MVLSISAADAQSYMVWLEYGYDVSGTPYVASPYDTYTQTFLDVTLPGSPYSVAYVPGLPDGVGHTKREVIAYHLTAPSDWLDIYPGEVTVGQSPFPKYVNGHLNLYDLAGTGLPGDAFQIEGSDVGGTDPDGDGTGGEDPEGDGTTGGDPDTSTLLDNIDMAALNALFAAGNAGWSDELPRLIFSRGDAAGTELSSGLVGGALNYFGQLGSYAASGWDEMLERVDRKQTLLEDYADRMLGFLDVRLDDLSRELETGEATYRDHEKDFRRARIEELDNDAFDAGLEDLGVGDFARGLLREFTLFAERAGELGASFGETFRASVTSEATIGAGVRKIIGSAEGDVFVNLDDVIKDGLDKVALGLGDDRFYDGDGRAKVKGGGGDDDIFAYGGNDVVIAGGGDDFVFAGGGRDKVKAGGGDDMVDGGGGKDSLSLGGGRDVAYGAGGKDKLDGAGGEDLLFGGSGKDQIKGGGGDDFLAGGKGSDDLWGDKGADVFAFETFAGRDWIRDFTPGEDVIQVSGGSFRELSFERAGFHTFVRWGDDEIVLEGVLPDELDRADFIF